LELFDAVWPKEIPAKFGCKAIRLVGFGVTNIRQQPNDGGQMELFENPDETVRNKRERLSDALDRLYQMKKRP
jgi:hypothetical protein